MDLWIRSQDREALTKVNMGIMYWKDTDDRDCIVNKDNATGYSILAEYKTKERALEVLDEIQNILQPKVIWKEPKTDIKYSEDFIQTLAQDMVIQTTQQVEYDLKEAGQIVYEMPEE